LKKVIWKFRLNLMEEQILLLPFGAEVLTVQMQGGVIVLWAVVSPAAAKVQWRFFIIGTGNDFIRLGTYIGTVQQPPYVWHVFMAPIEGNFKT